MYDSGMSDYGEWLDSVEPDDLHSMWIAVLNRIPDDPPNNFSIRQGHRMDALGILCHLSELLHLDSLTDEEWDRAAPPYRTARLAGLRCSKDANGMAKGGQIDGIIALIDGGASNKLIAEVLSRGQIIHDLRKLFER